jgi:peroxiredoxin
MTTTALTAPAFSLPGADGMAHTLDDYADAKALALVQSCNHCPYVQAWEDRMISLQSQYADRGFRLVAIASNDAENYPEDSFEEMKRRAEKRGFTFDYLYDESQQIARTLGAGRTPEVFLFGPERTLLYHGAIDDNLDEGAVTKHYLRDAIEAVLEGREPEVKDTPAVGCTVKWKR